MINEKNHKQPQVESELNQTISRTVIENDNFTTGLGTDSYSADNLPVPAEITGFSGPGRLCKKMYKDADGNIKKEAGSQYVDQGITIGIDSIEGLNKYIDARAKMEFDLKIKVLCYGVLIGKNINEPYNLTIKSKETDECQARTNDNYEFPDMMVLMFDLDKFGDLSPEEQLKIFFNLNPELAQTDYIIKPSSSSNVVDTSTDDTPKITGYHIYFFCLGKDINNIVDTVWNRCWLAGYGRVILSKSGAMLERAIFDKSIYQPSRLDFIGGVECEPPLEQKPIVSEIRKNQYRYLDFDRFEKLPESKVVEVKQIIASQKQELKPEVRKKQKEFRNERLKNTTRKERKTYNHILKQAQEENELEDDFTVWVYTKEGLQEIKVAELRNNPEECDGCRCCDPLEPEYKDYSPCGIINVHSNGQVTIHDFHSGLTYKLGTKAVAIADGNRILFGQYEIPEGCFVEDDCIYKYEDPKSGKVKLICSNPIAVSKRIRQISDDSLLVNLIYKDNGMIRYVQVPRSTIAGKEITSLANYGINVNSTNAQVLSGYLLEIERLNLRKAIREVTGLQTLGWAKINDEMYFLTGTEYITKHGVFSIYDEKKNNMPFEFDLPDPVLKFLLESVRRQGSRDKWIEAAKRLNPFAYPKIMIAAAACSPLLRLLGVANFIIHLGYPSSSGKSSCMNMAASAVGDFTTLIETWNSTVVAIERKAYFLNCVPPFLDETKTITAHNKNDLIREVIYMHSSGIAKGRGNRNGRQRVLRWHSVAFSTGEANLLAEVQDGGAKARVLDLPDLPFSKRSLETAKLIDNVVSVMQDNFGHAMVEVIAYVLKDGSNALQKCKDRLAALNEEIKAILPPGIGIRLANIVAFILVSVEILNDVLNLGWSVDDVKDTLLDCAKKQSSDDSEGNKALRYIYGYACANIGEACDEKGNYKHSGFVMGMANDKEMQQRFKYRSIKRGGSCIGILGPTNFMIIDNFIKEILRDAGFEPDSIFKEWKLKSFLSCSGKDYVSQPKLFGQRPRVISLNERAMLEVGHCTEEEVEEFEEMNKDPFGL